MTDDVAERAANVVADALREYAESRVTFYRSRTIDHLLAKDVVMFALRGIVDADDFVESAFSAHESSSEEGVMANTWTKILLDLTHLPVVQGGDLLVSQGDILWIVQVKNSLTTFTDPARIQTFRELKERVEYQSTISRPRHQRVRPMIGVIRGPSKDQEMTYRRSSRTRTENQDIQGFQYRYMVGPAFWKWLTGRPNIVELLPDWQASGTALRSERADALDRLKEALRARLDEAGLEPTISSVITLASSDG